MQSTATNNYPRTARGEKTRQALLNAAEKVFGKLGYHNASVTEITRTAKVGQGTFYIYFSSKQDIFIELVRHMSHLMRQHLETSTAGAFNRIEAERAGLLAFLQFVKKHPNLYRIVRECEFVTPDEYKAWYMSLADGYVKRLKAAMDRGEIKQLDPEILSYCLMGIGDFLGMRLVLWNDEKYRLEEAVDVAIKLIAEGIKSS
jgi:AcrR family transcriptional regulator